MTKRVFTVLAIDGGGVRGVIPARILQEIEERTGKPISELFDLVVGTSTGSIIAGGLNVPDPDNPKKPKYSAKDMLGFYLHDAPEIFPEVRFRQIKHVLPGTTGFYDPKPFEEILKKKMGDARMEDSLTHLMIPGVDIKHYRPVWMRHFKGKKDVDGWGTLKIRDAIRASSAAPTLLPTKYIYTNPNPNAPDASERHALIDGSLFAGTITRRAYTAAQKLAPPDAEIVVVHLGTGNTSAVITPEEYNKLTPLGLVNSDKHPSIISMMIEMVSRDVNNDLKEEIGDRFFTFDKEFDPDDPNGPDSSIDNADLKNLAALKVFAEKLIEEEDEALTRLCKILLHKTYVRELHAESQKAYQELVKQLESADSPKVLEKLYRKIVKYSSELEDIKVDKGDEEVAKIAPKLLEPQKQQIDRIHAALQNKFEIQKQNKAGAFRRFGRWLTKPFRSDDSKPSNDNDRAVVDRDRRHNRGGPRP